MITSISSERLSGSILTLITKNGSASAARYLRCWAMSWGLLFWNNWSANGDKYPGSATMEYLWGIHRQREWIRPHDRHNHQICLRRLR
jgi:hypothetical protein